MQTIKIITIVSMVLASMVPWVGQVSAACRNDIVRTTPDRAFTIRADGLTVTDHRTGLVWDRCLLGQSGASCSGTVTTYTWQQALIEATTRNTQTYKGFNDWRLPNIKELATLVEDACFDPAFNTAVFVNHPVSGNAWSSSPTSADSSNASWAMNFSGLSTTHSRDSAYAVRLVRDGI